MPRLALVLLVLFVSACDAVGGGQALFEDEAYGLPPGAAPTWRVSPALDTRIQLNPTLLEFPPVSPADNLSIQFFDNEAAPGGYALYYLTDQVPRELVLVAQTPGLSQPTFYTLDFFGANVNAGNPGVYRLMVLGTGQRVIAFGDLTIE
jgi:hypothetical protein